MTVADSLTSPQRDAFQLLCPVCRNGQRSLPDRKVGTWPCSSCGFAFGQHDGIFRALPKPRSQYYERFVSEYLTIRKSEGRGSNAPAYYLALPFDDLSGKQATQWRIRAKGYRYVERRILPALEHELSGGINILDLGAGTGWLSYRLALRGHRPVAVDLITDPLEGLGAAKHYFPELSREFPLYQAEFDQPTLCRRTVRLGNL